MEIEIYGIDAVIGEEDPIDTYESERVPEVGESIQVDPGTGTFTFTVKEIVNSTQIDGDVVVRAKF